MDEEDRVLTVATVKKLVVTVAVVWLLAVLAVFILELFASEEGESALLVFLSAGG